MKIEFGDHSMRIRIAFDSNLTCSKLIQVLSIDPQTLECAAFRRSCGDRESGGRGPFNGRLRDRGAPKRAPGPPAFTDRTPWRFTGR
jgi:hypothetical protein